MTIYTVLNKHHLFSLWGQGYIVKYKIMYLCTYYGVPVHYIYIYVKLSSSLPKDISYTTNSTVHCMTHAPFVIVCTLPYIWTIKNKDKVLFFLNLIHRLSDQSICIETKRTFKRKVNINKFLKHFNILLYTN